MRRSALLISLLLICSGVASASEHDRPPVAVLKALDVHQKGKLGSYCWSWENSDGSGSGRCVDYAGYRWPRVQRTDRNGDATITIRYEEAPSETSLTYWRRVDERRNPVGQGTELEHTLAPRPAGDATVWDVTFVVPGYRGHFYLAGFMRWDAGDSSYAWHLRLR